MGDRFASRAEEEEVAGTEDLPGQGEEVCRAGRAPRSPVSRPPPHGLVGLRLPVAVPGELHAVQRHHRLHVARAVGPFPGAPAPQVGDAHPARGRRHQGVPAGREAEDALLPGHQPVRVRRARRPAVRQADPELVVRLPLAGLRRGDAGAPREEAREPGAGRRRRAVVAGGGSGPELGAEGDAVGFPPPELAVLGIRPPHATPVHPGAVAVRSGDPEPAVVALLHHRQPLAAEPLGDQLGAMGGPGPARRPGRTHESALRRRRRGHSRSSPISRRRSQSASSRSRGSHSKPTIPWARRGPTSPKAAGRLP